MAFLLRKVMKSWVTPRESHSFRGLDHPTQPPSPDLSHLNKEEISTITDVIRRQEMFERAEADRVRKIQEDLEGLQKQLVEMSKEGKERMKAVDLRLCRLCFKNKFADGVGRVCVDCHQRVCAQCGAFSKPRWNSKKNKTVRGKWQCKLCTAQREALCRTGGWYHGQWDSSDAGLGLMKKLPSNWDVDTDAGSSTYQGNGTTNVEEDSENYPSGNRSDSELFHHKSMLINSINTRRSCPKHTASRRFSLSSDLWSSMDRGGGVWHAHDTDGNRRFRGEVIEDDEDDQDSFDSLVLERKLSRKRRQEKRQRRKFRNDNEKVPEENTTQHAVTNGDSFQRSEPKQLDPIVDRTNDIPLEHDESRKSFKSPSLAAIGHSKSVNVGHDVLEWNNDCLRERTYDQVVTETSDIYPNVPSVLNPAQRSDGEVNGESTASENQLGRTASTDSQGWPTKRRMLPRTPVEIKRALRQVKGELQIKLAFHSYSGSLEVTIVGSRRLVMPEQDGHMVLNPYVMVYLVPCRCDSEPIDTELKASDGHPELAQSFHFDNFSITELMSKSVALCVWNSDNTRGVFLGEVLVDLVDTDLTDQPVWYQLHDHDENSSALPTRGHTRSTSMSESLTSGSFNFISPAVSPEVSSYRHLHSSPSLGANASPVPSFSRVGSREFQLNSPSQSDMFITKVRKKMRNTVNKMSSLSLSDKKECSDDSTINDTIQRYSSRSDRSPNTRSPNVLKKRQNFREHSGDYSSMDLLAPPKSLSRTNSASSFYISEDEESRRDLSISSGTSDRPVADGDDITSILGPGQIPPKPSAETSVCGDVKLGFMMSKGQLEVDIICAAGLLKSGMQQAPDTYVKTYLVEGKKVIQRKKTLVVKASFDPVYRKKIKYSACNVHGRIMKIDVWEKVGSFEKKVCRGEVLVKLDGLDLSTHAMAWYKLFQMNATDYGSDELFSSW